MVNGVVRPAACCGQTMSPFKSATTATNAISMPMTLMESMTPSLAPWQSASMLFCAVRWTAKWQRVPVSLATNYNTLNQFTEAGLLREVAVDGSKTYFDTNTSEHHHFFVEDDNVVMDIPAGQMGVGRVPEAPPGYEISRIDVVVRLRRIRA